MARHPLDRLPAGTSLPEGWGGTAQHDHLDNGLYAEGPQPALSPLVRLIQSSAAQGDPLPPALANAALSRDAQRSKRFRSFLVRSGIRPNMAQRPPAQVRPRKRLKPLRVGRVC